MTNQKFFPAEADAVKTFVRSPHPLQVNLNGLRELAVERMAHWPKYKKSMRGTAANEVGALGEIVALNYLQQLNVTIHDAKEITHDLLVNNKTIDVKTKERTVPPKPHYDCSVPHYLNGIQEPDYYLFVSLQSNGQTGINRFTKAWILGTLPNHTFKQQATLWTPQQTDTRNNWKATIPVWNVPISQLNGPLKPT